MARRLAPHGSKGKGEEQDFSLLLQLPNGDETFRADTSRALIEATREKACRLVERIGPCILEIHPPGSYRLAEHSERHKWACVLRLRKPGYAPLEEEAYFSENDLEPRAAEVPPSHDVNENEGLQRRGELLRRKELQRVREIVSAAVSASLQRFLSNGSELGPLPPETSPSLE